MINLKVPKKLIEYCQSQIESYDFGKRLEFNGDKEQQLTGIIGQSVVMHYFDLGFVDGSKGFDDGVDIVYSGVKIDVKTMGRKSNVKPYYTNNFVAFQDKFHPDAYIFCSYHKTLEEITICGWVSKEKFYEKRKFYPKGTIRTRGDGTEFISGSDLYEIDMMDLNDVFDFYDLKTQLKQYSLKKNLF